MKVEPEVVDGGASAEMHRVLSSTHVSGPRARHAVSVLLIVVAIVALFWRVFFLGETLIDVNTLNNQLPWGSSSGQSDYPYNRRDLTDTYVTRDYFVAAAYRDGEFPLWNPYTMAGHPIYADGVTRTLSPFLLFYKFFDVPLGYSLARIIELMLAAIFMYIFLVAIGASANGALMGSLVFGFSAHSMFHLTGLGWWGGLMWLPLIVLFVDRGIVRRSFSQATLAGVCLGAQFFCGYLPNQIYYVVAIVLYYLFFALIERGGERELRAVGRSLALMAVTLAVGLAVSATQWVPALELLSYSNRRVVGAELGYIYLPPWYAATLVFPNLFGTAYDPKLLTLFTALGVSHDHILYLGVAALVPLGLSLYWIRLSREKRREYAEPKIPNFDPTLRARAKFFAALAAFSLVIMMAAPLYVPVTRYIPVLQVIRVAVRAGVLFLFAAATLVAFGTDLLLSSGVDTLRRFASLARRFSVWIFGFLALGVAGSYLVRFVGFAVDTGERGRLAFIRRAGAALSVQFTPPNLSLLIPLALILVVAFLLWAFAEGRLVRKSFFACVVALLMADLFWNSTQFDRSFERSRVFPKTEITDLLHSLPAGRVLVVPSGLETNRRVSSGPGEQKIIAPPNTLLAYQIPTVTGKNQQFPRWYREFASLIEPQPNLSHVVFDEYRSRFFDLLNVRYVMTHESAPPLGGYELLAVNEGVSLYENKNALPRAFFAPSAIAVSTAAESLALMRDPNFDPENQTVVEASAAKGPLLPIESLVPDSGSTDRASAEITEDGRNRVVVDTDNSRDGLLVLCDNYYPGWQAWIDGSPVEVLRANHAMRAVNVPAGRHVISFRFVPAVFFLSMYVSLAAAALTLVVLILFAIKRRQR